MMGLKAQLNRKLHECGRDPLSLFLLGCVIAAALITFMVLSFLLGYILWQGLPNIETGLFALQYNSENVSLFPALVDTVLMVIMALAIATPLGIFAAVYLVEYASRGNRLVSLVRVTADTLAGIPSIVYGLFGMLFFVTYLKWGYSLLAGACTVAIMILPLIMRTTEEALKAIPDSYREGSYGLGAGKLRTVFAVVLPSAVPGGAYVCAGQRGFVHETGLCDGCNFSCDRCCYQRSVEQTGKTIDEGKIIWIRK